MPIKFLNSGLLEGSLQLTSYGGGSISGTATYNLSVDSSGNVIETDAVPANIVETVTTTDGTYINLTPNSPTDGAVTVTADLSAVDGTSGANERYLTKTNKWAEISTIPGTYTFDVEGDTGGNHAVASGSTLELFGGTYISSNSYSGVGVTFNHDATTRNDTTSSASPGVGGTFTVVDLVSTNATGHLERINVKTVTLPDDGIDGSGTLNYVAKFTPDGDTIGDSQIFDNGTNVGIGTASITDSRVQIKGAGNATNTYVDGLKVTSNNETVYTQYNWNGINNNTGLLFAIGGTERMQITSDSNPTLRLGVSGTGTSIFEMKSASGGSSVIDVEQFLQIKTSGSERMRIDASGNASIGDGGAGARNSRLLLQNAGSQGAPQLMLIDSGDSGKQSEIRFDSGNLIFDYWNGSSRSERMRIDSSGQVGINTPVPEAKLGVFGGSLGSTSGNSVTHAQIRGDRHRLDFKEVRTANGTDWNNTTYKLQMRVDSTNHQSIDFVSDASFAEHIDIYTGNQVFNTRFTANGNVGIGTENPSTKLEVDGNIQANNSGGAVLNLKNTNTSMTPPEPYGTINFIGNEPNSSSPVAYITAERALNNAVGSSFMKFYTAPSAPFQPALALTIANNRNLEVEFGARFKKTGGTFGSSFNYYQRGSFTPTYTGTTVYTYGTRHGYYERIGDWVHVQIEISTGYTSGAGSSGAAKIAGLPFTVGRVTCCPTYIMQPTGAMSDVSLMGVNFESTKAVPVGVVNTTTIQFEYTDKGSTGKTIVTPANFFRSGGYTNGNHMQVTISYLTT